MTTATQSVVGIDATYYMTKDLAKATAYYSDLLGVEPSMHVPGLVTEFTFKDGETFGLYQPGADGFYTSGGAMFAVEDPHAFVAAATARGVAFDDGGRISEQPGCFMAFGTDPEGNHFIVHKRK